MSSRDYRSQGSMGPRLRFRISPSETVFCYLTERPVIQTRRMIELDRHDCSLAVTRQYSYISNIITIIYPPPPRISQPPIPPGKPESPAFPVVVSLPRIRPPLFSPSSHRPSTRSASTYAGVHASPAPDRINPTPAAGFVPVYGRPHSHTSPYR